MSFLASYFSFDGISCEEYGLRIYDIDGNNNKAVPFASAGKIITDAIPKTGRNFLYGRDLSSPLEFEITFGLEPCHLDMNDYMDRFDMDKVANWLTSPTDYRWLEIQQADMENIRYRCVISELTPIEISWLPFAFTAKITCDSPYATMLPVTYSIIGATSANLEIDNRSTLNVPYRPKIKVTANGALGANSALTIFDSDTSTMVFQLALPSLASGTIVEIDNERGTIVSSGGENLYADFDFNWFSLKRGINNLVVSVSNGNGNVDIICEYPVNFGG